MRRFVAIVVLTVVVLFLGVGEASAVVTVPPGVDVTYTNDTARSAKTLTLSGVTPSSLAVAAYPVGCPKPLVADPRGPEPVVVVAFGKACIAPGASITVHYHYGVPAQVEASWVPGSVQGDFDCNDFVGASDAQGVLRAVAGEFFPAVAGCYYVDADCDGDEDPVDALLILRFLAKLPVDQDEPCPDLGQ